MVGGGWLVVGGGVGLRDRHENKCAITVTLKSRCAHIFWHNSNIIERKYCSLALCAATTIYSKSSAAQQYVVGAQEVPEQLFRIMAKVVVCV